MCGNMGGGAGSLQESDERPLGDTRSSGSNLNPITVQPFAPNPSELRAAIGTKGNSIGIEEAIKGANPFYNTSGAEGDFSQNCQRCVVAYELRRRGYDVVALPTYAGDKLPGGERWAGAFQKAKSVKVGASTYKG